MTRQILILILFLASALAASALNCGTVAAPGTCVLNVGGQVQYTFTNFQLVSSSASGTDAVSGADITINANSGLNLSAVLSFDKVVTGGNPNSVFLANASDTNNFIFSYGVSIAPLTPGTVLFINPAEVDIVQRSTAGNGFGSVQFSMPSAPACQATTTNQNDVCTLPAGVTDSMPSVGNIVVLSGNTGNVSIGVFTNTFNASFTADQPSGVPEPSTYALIGAGLGAIYTMRRRR